MAFFRWVFEVFQVEYYSTLRSNNPRDQERLVDFRSLTRRSNSSHNSPMGFKSGDWGSHSIILRSPAAFFVTNKKYKVYMYISDRYLVGKWIHDQLNWCQMVLHGVGVYCDTALFHNSFNFFKLINASVAETAQNHYWATAMFHSWHNTIWFESFIDFSANILTPMATEKFEFWFVCP